MAIIGSVVDTQTVVTLTDTPEKVTFPQANLTVVGIVHNAVYVSIPIDSSRSAFFPNTGAKSTTGQVTQIVGALRRIHFTINGTQLNYNIYTKGTSSTVCFYYGSPLQNSRDYRQFAGIAAISTLSGGAGTATLTFPSGPLTMTGFAAALGNAAQSGVIQAAWSTSSGQVFNCFALAGTVTAFDGNALDILPLNLRVSQTVTVTITLGTGADVVVLFAYYQMV
jgi:hypothetical protein